MFAMSCNTKTRQKLLSDLLFRNYYFNFLNKNKIVINDECPDDMYYNEGKLYHIDNMTPFKKHISWLKYLELTEAKRNMEA